MSTEHETLEAPLGATAERQAVISAQGAAPDKDWVIVTRGIKREYDMGGEVVRALRGVDLAIQRNEYVAIMGPSGSGKSTLMNVIGCLDTPTAGEYWLNGTQVSKMSDDELARVRNKEIGFVFQTFNLLPRATALHNVELPLVYAGVGGDERKRRAREALDRVQLGDRMDHRPNELSGGQRQRVAIARALMAEPEVLLLDEPTSALDVSVQAEVLNLLADLQAARGLTYVLVSHNLAVVAHLCARIGVMQDGELVEELSAEDLRAGRTMHPHTAALRGLTLALEEPDR